MKLVLLLLIFAIAFSSCTSLSPKHQKLYKEGIELQKKKQYKKALLKFEEANALFLTGNQEMFDSQLEEALEKARIGKFGEAYEILNDLTSLVRREKSRNKRRKLYKKIIAKRKSIRRFKRGVNRRRNRIGARRLEKAYRRALRLFKKGKHLSAYNLFIRLNSYKDSPSYLAKTKPYVKQYIEKQFQEGMKQYRAEKYKQAVFIFGKVIKLSRGEHETARYFRDKARRKLEILEEK